MKKINKLLWLPLDNRHTTMGLFQKYADFAGEKLIGLSLNQVNNSKKRIPRQEILSFLDRDYSDIDAVIISSDMLVYGGLIPSRVGHESLDELMADLSKLQQIRRQNPDIQIMVSASVMRTPNSDCAIEEPDYYAIHGKRIANYCYHAHRYECLNDPLDLERIEILRQQIPPEILDDFLNRRIRNFAINRSLINFVREGIINYLIIGLDDNAPFGFSRKEGDKLGELAKDMTESVKIFSGADELQLLLLSRLILASYRPLRINPIYYRPNQKQLIPAFEAKPLIDSVTEHIHAAGSEVCDLCHKADVLLLINNTGRDPQPHAMYDSNGVVPEEVNRMVEWLRQWFDQAGNRPVVIADCAYSNGADRNLIEALQILRPNPSTFVYSGWNTAGNTLGSAVVLGNLAFLVDPACPNHLALLNFERLVEDWAYMVEVRPTVIRELGHEPVFDNFAIPESEKQKIQSLTTDLLKKYLDHINRAWSVNYELGSVQNNDSTFAVSFSLWEKNVCCDP